MSKPWFLKIAMESGPSPLSGTIAQILRRKESVKETEQDVPIASPPPASLQYFDINKDNEGCSDVLTINAVRFMKITVQIFQPLFHSNFQVAVLHEWQDEMYYCDSIFLKAKYCTDTEDKTLERKCGVDTTIEHPTKEALLFIDYPPNC